MSRYISRNGEAQPLTEVVANDISDFVLDAYNERKKCNSTPDEAYYKGMEDAYTFMLKYWKKICVQLDRKPRERIQDDEEMREWRSMDD